MIVIFDALFIYSVVICSHLSLADPGFSRGGGANSPGGAPTYDFAKFSQKLHDIERIWTGGRVSKILLCRSATACISTCVYFL